MSARTISARGHHTRHNARAFAPEQLAQVAAAGRYLEHTDEPGPVVFVVEGRSLARQDHIIRAGLPAELIPRALLYLGEAANLFEGRPTFTGDPKADAGATGSWAQVAPIFDERTTVLQLSTFQRRQGPAAVGVEVAAGVRVLQGPSIGAPIPIPPQETVGPVVLVLSALGILLLIAAVGSGWSTWVVRATLLPRLGLAPAFGFAALVLSGLFVDRLGFHLGGPPGVVALVTAGMLGWVPMLARHRPASGSAAAPG